MRHQIFDIPIDDLSDGELDQILHEWVVGNAQKIITTPNPEFLLLSRHDASFKSILQKSDLSLPDGVGLRFAVVALTDETLKHRQTGVDLVDRLMRIGAETGKRLVVVDGLDRSAEKVKATFEQKYPGIQLSTFQPGSISFPLSESIMNRLNELHPEILLVALGQGKQERFIEDILPNIPSIRIAVGVGGAFDMLSGRKPRAPQILRRLGLEWLWRVLIEPRRIGRIFRAVFIFPLLVISCTLTSHRFWKAVRRVVPEIYRQLTGI